MTEQWKERGFSLIEINLAIFLVAMGMLTLFSLFPSGLKQIESAQESTQEALFADYVLSTLRADAVWITNATSWLDISTFQALDVELPSGQFVVHRSDPASVMFPDESQTDEALWMRYILQIGNAGNNLRSATLWCKSGRYGSTAPDVFKKGASKFYTEFFYSGMP